jgi:putative copper resistance protein D
VTGPEAALAACRFLHDGSAMLVGGASAYLAGLAPARLARDIERRLRRAGMVAIAIAVATAAAALPIESAALGEGWGDALDPAKLAGVLSTASIGTPWLVQIGGALGLAAAASLPSRPRTVAVSLAAALVLASLAFTGHAVMQTGPIGVAHRLNDAVHVLSAAAWLGALLPLLLVLRRLDSCEHRCEARLALSRFSTAGHVIVLLILLSGVVNTALVLGRPPTDWSSPYQALLAAKIIVVIAMVGLATANRYVFVPRLATDRAAGLAAIRRTTLVELALAFAAVALVSVFGILDPA